MKALLFSLLLTASAFAGVEAYTGTAGEKLFIEDGGKGTYFVKFSGTESPWKEKVIKTKRDGTTSNHYQFDYKLELSSGVHDRTYTLVTQEGEALVSGSLVKRVKLWTQEKAKDGTVLKWDKKLTEESQKLDLAGEFKKKPFSPEVE